MTSRFEFSTLPHILYVPQTVKVYSFGCSQECNTYSKHASSPVPTAPRAATEVLFDWWDVNTDSTESPYCVYHPEDDSDGEREVDLNKCMNQ